MNRQFLVNLQVILHEFRMYQLDNNEEYSFDLLGFMEWFEAEKGYATSDRELKIKE